MRLNEESLTVQAEVEQPPGGGGVDSNVPGGPSDNLVASYPTPDENTPDAVSNQKRYVVAHMNLLSITELIGLFSSDVIYCL